MSQIIRITSEALQATIRRLLPSQQGFGEDLQASNVIMPVIDVTPTAEGTQLPVSLQQAFSFGSQTAFEIPNAQDTTILNTPGFYRVYANVSVRNSTAVVKAKINLVEGATTKTLIGFQMSGHNGTETQTSQIVDFIVFLATGQEVKVNTDTNGLQVVGSTRQIADVQGNLVNPTGFAFQ